LAATRSAAPRGGGGGACAPTGRPRAGRMPRGERAPGGSDPGAPSGHPRRPPRRRAAPRSSPSRGRGGWSGGGGFGRGDDARDLRFTPARSEPLYVREHDTDNQQVFLRPGPGRFSVSYVFFEWLPRSRVGVHRQTYVLTSDASRMNPQTTNNSWIRPRPFRSPIELCQSVEVWSLAAAPRRAWDTHIQAS